MDDNGEDKSLLDIRNELKKSHKKKSNKGQIDETTRLQPKISQKIKLQRKNKKRLEEKLHPFPSKLFSKKFFG